MGTPKIKENEEGMLKIKDDEQGADGEARTVPILGDGDDDDGSEHGSNLGITQPICTWTKDIDEHRRAFVIEKMADSNIDGKTMVKNMDSVYRWLKDGSMPIERNDKKTTFKAIE
jgi:hypothetical protein